MGQALRHNRELMQLKESKENLFALASYRCTSVESSINPPSACLQHSRTYLFGLTSGGKVALCNSMALLETLLNPVTISFIINQQIRQITKTTKPVTPANIILSGALRPKPPAYCFTKTEAVTSPVNHDINFIPLLIDKSSFFSISKFQPGSPLTAILFSNPVLLFPLKPRLKWIEPLGTGRG